MDLRKEAERLAAGGYNVQFIKDETTSGQPIYVAISPELEGCIAQGETIDDALASLHKARVDYIQSLLEDGLPVPEPQSIPTTTTSSLTANFAYLSRLSDPSPVLKPIREQPNDYNLTHLVGASLPQ